MHKLKGEANVPISLKKTPRKNPSQNPCLTELCFYAFKNAGFLLS